MKDALKKLVTKDEQQPARAWRLGYLEEFRTSTIYDRLPNCFADEKESNGKYIPLRNRRPSVRFGLPQIIVQDSVSLTFGEDHFPAVDVQVKKEKGAENKPKSDDANEKITHLIAETAMRELFQDAATKGSNGSVAILVKLLSRRFFFEAMPTRYLTPTFAKDEPDRIELVREQYKTTRAALIAQGYNMPADVTATDQTEYWFRRDWTISDEVWYQPWRVVDPQLAGSTREKTPVVDTERSTKHSLGFVPIIWNKNLPGGDAIDGACTFEPAIDNMIEIDYQLSQGGRGLKYSADPTLHIRDPAGSEFGGGSLVRGAANAIVTGQDSDVKLLEISGSASAAVLDYVRFLREISMELCGGNRASPEKLSGAQSGRAMELMNQGLVWLAGKLRTSYGQNGLVKLLKMILEIAASNDIMIDGEIVAKGTLPSPADVTIVLNWPEWYAPTAADQQAKAAGLTAHLTAGVISEETATKQVAPEYDIEDVAAERKLIEKERTAKQDAQIALTNATKPPVGGSLSRVA